VGKPEYQYRTDLAIVRSASSIGCFPLDVFLDVLCAVLERSTILGDGRRVCPCSNCACSQPCVFRCPACKHVGWACVAQDGECYPFCGRFECDTHDRSMVLPWVVDWRLCCHFQQSRMSVTLFASGCTPNPESSGVQPASTWVCIVAQDMRCPSYSRRVECDTLDWLRILPWAVDWRVCCHHSNHVRQSRSSRAVCSPWVCRCPACKHLGVHCRTG
jgi:hypothetical protein